MSTFKLCQVILYLALIKAPGVAEPLLAVAWITNSRCEAEGRPKTHECEKAPWNREPFLGVFYLKISTRGRMDYLSVDRRL